MILWIQHQRLLIGFIACCMIGLNSQLQAREIQLESPVESVTVLELFTSHGCSSCPPADKWIRQFSQNQGLWSKVIPMAFHVDYWDYLGWKDRFARSKYSKRQRQYRESGGIRAVYTPGFVVNGREWRGWFSGGTPELSPGKKVGRLTARITPNSQISATFKPITQESHSDINAHVVILGFGISSDIGGGENSGRELKADFVVLGDSSATSTDSLQWIIPWPIIRDSGATRLAIVVWLSRKGDPAPIQAVAGWLGSNN